MAIHQKLLLGVWCWKPRKEALLDHGQRRMVADKCPWVFSEALLHGCGTAVQFGRRPRVIPPLRVGLALTAPWASQRVETSADGPCGFQARCGTTVPSQAGDTPVATPHCAECARTMTARLLGDMTLQGLGVAKGRAVAAFRP